ncbi:uncharacterized protein L3040_001957 [Drepanopeziza brunnea f. sp. 'multigermtubi']|uniref:F-box domain-containing protein n=1 Tax=Marssonina brunnea f. sp. multigermtubi (strain MB_m1) TaxID=1072389 RepID=K1X3A7_MARBU|nr:F-box domain-containing protein [Drepanopeziza brunnea f. sp. 'multigermtubi' MB_m1]EKD19696.1 F-box domain-containing protein [Drepanopeziza brunnea f. sp. 'multigermtubi' MB_m1]KAJ5052198.1 hypothetical protein L3040_001957 [Drepanopeziza brunnea f. sp. 'multigermtubi']
MPGLPPPHRRRKKTPTFIKQLDREDVWRRSLYVLGLEPINAQSSTPNSSSSSSVMASCVMASQTASTASTAPVAPETTSAEQTKEPTTFLSLSGEIQREIFQHATSPDLTALSLVSKHFRDLAAEQIYRRFQITFTEEDGILHDYPFDSLAAGLDTFATSEYDHAQYLKEFRVLNEGGGEKTERAFRSFSFDVSCGKFMNTLLLLTLRKAKNLEVFQWDIRIELSRPVYKALHQIQALQHLHLRMQPGPSLWLPLGPLPTSLLPPTHGMQQASGSSVAPLPVILPVPAGSTNSFQFGNKIAKICQKPPVKNPIKSQPPPPTMSGFKNLKTLTVLDMDTLEYLDELRACVGNSSATLRSLTLSFSEALVAKSRKPQPDPHSDDDSDQEDEFGQVNPPPGTASINPALGASDPNGPSRLIKALEEKKMQESALGRILGVESVAPKPKPVVPKLKVEKPMPEEDPRRRFIQNLTLIASKLMSHVQPGSDLSTEGAKTLEMIEEAARQYLASNEKGKGKDKGKDPASSVEITTNSTPASLTASGEDGAVAVMSSAVLPEEAGLFDAPDTKRSVKDESGCSNPEDINVEEPDDQDLLIDFDVSTDTVAEDDLPVALAGDEAETEIAGSLVETMERFQNELAGIEQSIRELSLAFSVDPLATSVMQQNESLAKKLNKLRDEIISDMKDMDVTFFTQALTKIERITRSNVELLTNMRDPEMKKKQKTLHDALETQETQMSAYIRNTRGLTLESLSIYLIPIKASIISRCIDLNVLQSITLLNVGPQAPFWNLVAKENLIMPLPIQKIHTDNVTIPLLLCLSGLDKLSELILLERATKERGESTAAKSVVTVEDIRKMVLRKHASNLRVLVIRNDNPNHDWQLNIKTIMVLCRRAKKLEELGCSFGTPAMHTLLQYMSGLSSLRVLHTITFHNEDNCTWVMREFRKFTVDIISQNPDMKLEYLALEKSVERLVRRKPMPKPKSDKGKAIDLDWTSAKALAELIMGSNAGSWGDESKYDFQDSDDDDEGIVQTGLRVETVDSVRFSQVTGVRIFERAVITGKL